MQASVVKIRKASGKQKKKAAASSADVSDEEIAPTNEAHEAPDASAEAATTEAAATTATATAGPATAGAAPVGPAPAVTMSSADLKVLFTALAAAERDSGRYKHADAAELIATAVSQTVSQTLLHITTQMGANTAAMVRELSKDPKTPLQKLIDQATIPVKHRPSVAEACKLFEDSFQPNREPLSPVDEVIATYGIYGSTEDMAWYFVHIAVAHQEQLLLHNLFVAVRMATTDPSFWETFGAAVFKLETHLLPPVEAFRGINHAKLRAVGAGPLASVTPPVIVGGAPPVKGSLAFAAERKPKGGAPMDATRSALKAAELVGGAYIAPLKDSAEYGKHTDLTEVQEAFQGLEDRVNDTQRAMGSIEKQMGQLLAMMKDGGSRTFQSGGYSKKRSGKFGGRGGRGGPRGGGAEESSEEGDEPAPAQQPPTVTSQQRKPKATESGF